MSQRIVGKNVTTTMREYDTPVLATLTPTDRVALIGWGDDHYARVIYGTQARADLFLIMHALERCGASILPSHVEKLGKEINDGCDIIWRYPDELWKWGTRQTPCLGASLVRGLLQEGVLRIAVRTNIRTRVLTTVLEFVPGELEVWEASRLLMLEDE